MLRFSPRFVSAAIAAGLVLAACGSDAATDASTGTVEAEVATTVAPTTTAEETTTTTVAETTTTVEETTTTAAPVVAGPADGVLFNDPEGNYQLLISPDWVSATEEFPAGIEGWFTGQETAAFGENVNILDDVVPSLTPLPAILEASIIEVESQFENFSLIRSEVVPGVNHPELGLLEYTAAQDGFDIRFLQVFGVWDDTLVVFTASADFAVGEEAADRLRPYGLTLSPIS